MPSSGAWLLADAVAAGYRQIDVACTKCERRGRVSVARLLAEHGPDISMPDLRKHLAAGCPRLQSVSISDLCGVMYPTLRL
ncbi:MAG: hypothetical protein WA417_16075 [Stellaceae bacterium]